MAEKADRLVSLDVFRGITIAGMILVNNPGDWGNLYWPVEHAQWDGWTPTDFIFPFFLFIVGVAMTFSFDKRIAGGFSRVRLFEQVVRRTIILFCLGLILGGFPNFRLIMPYLLMIVGLDFLFRDEPIVGGGTTPSARRNKMIAWGVIAASVLWFVIDFGHFNGPVRKASFGNLFPLSNDVGGGILRVPGVLQRIALAYFFGSIIALTTKVWGRVAWSVALLLGYWLIMKFVHAPGGYTIIAGNGITPDAPAGAPFPGYLNDWIDVKLLGAHLYGSRPDPEGLLSTIPSIVTVLLGVLTGNLLHTERTRKNMALTMLGAGAVLVFLGAGFHFMMPIHEGAGPSRITGIMEGLHHFFPINKKIWSSSFVVFMGGWALMFLAFCYYLNDVLGWRKWAWPFVVYGTNAIYAFVGSGLLSRLMGMIKWNDGAVNLKGWIYDNLFKSWLHEPKNQSLGFAIFYVALWVVLTYPLYRKKIFLKI